jgi:hypothetical protein
MNRWRRPTAPWKVGKWHPSEAGDRPWYAHDRGAWFGNGLPGRCFKTHAEAFAYAFFMATLLDADSTEAS